LSGAGLALAASVFLACAVEAVEALTIVLAVGSTRSWRSAFAGVGAAIVSLGCIVAALGPALTALPLAALRLAVGALLLAFGLQWLRKAILRGAGLKALHDEEAEFAAAAAASRAAQADAGTIDGYAFAIAFKGVLLEGLEVAFIVLTFGSGQHRVGLAALAALAAVALVALAGAAARAPLARVPENTLKFSVGVLITSFGTFWSAEGAGASWPGADAALLVLVPAVAALALLAAAVLRRARAVQLGSPAAAPEPAHAVAAVAAAGASGVRAPAAGSRGAERGAPAEVIVLATEPAP
jgi:uncharacterized membrane protein